MRGKRRCASGGPLFRAEKAFVDEPPHQASSPVVAEPGELARPQLASIEQPVERRGGLGGEADPLLEEDQLDEWSRSVDERDARGCA